MTPGEYHDAGKCLCGHAFDRHFESDDEGHILFREMIREKYGYAHSGRGCYWNKERRITEYHSTVDVCDCDVYRPNAVQRRRPVPSSATQGALI